MRSQKRPLRSLLLVSTELLGAACSDESAAPTPLPAFEVLAVTDTIPTTFGNILSLRELSYALLVSDAMDRRLVVVDARTGEQRQIGRVGEGPGEYRRPSWLWAVSAESTIMVSTSNLDWDVLVGTQIVGALATDDPTVVAGVRGWVSLDTLGNALIVRNGNVVTDSQYLELFDRATGQRRLVARGDPPTEGLQNLPTYAQQYAEMLLAPDGWIAMRQARPHRVDWIAPDGTRILGDSIPQDAVRVDAAEKEYMLSNYPERRAAISREADVWPEYVPPVAVGSMLISSAGEVVVERYPTRLHHGRPYDVVGRRGQLVRRLLLPRNHKIVGFGRSSVYIEMTDDVGEVRLGMAAWPEASSAPETASQ